MLLAHRLHQQANARARACTHTAQLEEMPQYAPERALARSSRATAGRTENSH